MAFPNAPTGFRPNPIYHYLVKQTVYPCYWLSQKLTCLDAQKAEECMDKATEWLTYYLCKLN